MPSVSVLLPSYNHARFLAIALASLTSQTYQDWELIAIDDGSSDNSIQILSQVDDPRVRVEVNPTNLGTYGTLARALSLSRAEFVAVMNSDDEWSPEKLELQIGLLRSRSEIPLSYTAGRAFGSTDQADVHGDWPHEEVQELLPMLLEENRVLASSVMFRREHAGFQPSFRYSGDWEALLRPAKRGPFGFINQELTRWRIHDHNTFVRSAGQVSEEVRLRESILASEESWYVRDLPRSAISEGLSKCALHLSALLVLQQRMPEARRAARTAVRLSPNPSTLKRLVATNLPASMALARLWPGQEKLARGPETSLVSF